MSEAQDIRDDIERYLEENADISPELRRFMENLLCKTNAELLSFVEEIERKIEKGEL